MFEPVQPVWDPPALEHRWLREWRERGTLAAYLHRNDQSSTQFSFIDGPITANNPMGIHHAWGRTIKDLVQRYHTMLGQRQRYQNGFDCQGLWVEVEVEKELGFNSKRDIEAFGIDKFVERCKERVLRYARVQTDQSIRLGYFMDWDHSYYTMSDENNYTIWGVLKKCHEHGWIDRGHDVMPWCPRCATALSNMEIATEGYQEITHDSVYVRLPLRRRPGEYLLVWTTTPWTLSSNVAVAVNPDLTYVKVQQGDAIYYLSKGALKSALDGRFTVLQELRGEEMLGWSYEGPFDDLKVIRDALLANEQTHGPARGPESRREIVDEPDVPHWVIAWDDVGDAEGTGIVHIAPGCGREDYQLGRRELLPAPAPINEFGTFVEDYGWLTGMHVRDVAEPIFQELKSKGMLYRAAPYLHRYPVCWRCGSELVFRLVDEWFIRLDELRPHIMDVAKRITWIPSFGLDRELDWLRNMDDWMISKKRYWGLALPFYPCPQCGNLDVLGGKEELYERAIGGVHDLPSPHRPWIDAIKIRCSKCGAEVSRIADVGNPWLDAGIVPFSTLAYQHDKAHWRRWFPADFITESFPGQYRNWFYSLLTMATVLEDRPPLKTVLGHANVHDEDGEEMHKSKGNSISFDEAADRAGADVIRWTYMGHPPAVQMNFGYRVCDETRRRLLTLWNVYRFFVDYARIDSFDPSSPAPALAERTPLDRWVLARLHQTIDEVRSKLDQYDMPPAVRAIEAFIDDVSTWYVRRGRRRYWKPGADADKLAAYHTLYDVLVTVTKLIAPFMPFLAEELHDNLVPAPETGVQSVHLQDYPVVDPSLVDQPLLRAMASVQKVVELGRADRAKAGLKVRQSLPRVLVALPSDVDRTWFATLERHVSEELNVKLVEVVEEAGAIHDASIKPRMGVLGPRYGKDFPRLLTALREHSHTVHAGGGATVGGYHLKPDEIEIIARPREGLAVTEGDGFVVALDTSVTPDLEAEGHARDLVRRIQMMRKEAGLEIQDRIVLSYDAELELAFAIEQYGDYIRAETLALELRDGIEPDAAGAFAWSGEIAGEPVRLALVKATSAREA